MKHKNCLQMPGKVAMEVCLVLEQFKEIRLEKRLSRKDNVSQLLKIHTTPLKVV